MAKDPAFLWYPNDYIGGTMGMNHQLKGAYVDILMLQFNRGHMTYDMIAQVLGPEHERYWIELKSKFKTDKAGMYFNERLEIEIDKRRGYCSSRRNNVDGKNQFTKSEAQTEGQDVAHTTSQDENVNRNKDRVSNEIKGMQGDKTEYYPFDEFWTDYDKKVGDKDKLKKKWSGISAKDRKLIREFIPLYKANEPSKQYRKNPDTFLNNKSWLDELIEKETPKAKPKSGKTMITHKEYKPL